MASTKKEKMLRDRNKKLLERAPDLIRKMAYSLRNIGKLKPTDNSIYKALLILEATCKDVRKKLGKVK